MDFDFCLTFMDEHEIAIARNIVKRAYHNVTLDENVTASRMTTTMNEGMTEKILQLQAKLGKLTAVAN
jgi:hypothetical protein